MHWFLSNTRWFSFAFILTWVLLLTPKPSRSQEQDDLPSNKCVLQFTLPKGSTIKTSKRDYGTNRVVTYSKFTPGKTYYSDFEIRFPSGKTVKKRVLLEGGRRVTVAMVDPAVGRPEVMLQSNDTAGDVAWSKDGRYILAGRTLCDANTGRHLRQFPNPAYFQFGLAVAISPDNSMVAMAAKSTDTSKQSDQVHLYDLRSGKLLHQFGGVYSRAIAFGPKGDTLIAAGGDTAAYSESKGIVQIWNVKTGKTVRLLRSSQWIKTLAVSSDGRILITGSSDIRFHGKPNEVIVWNAASGQKVRQLKEGGNYHHFPISVATDGKLAVVAYSTRIQVWDLNNPNEAKYVVPVSTLNSLVGFMRDNNEFFIAETKDSYGKENVDTNVSFFSVESFEKIRSVKIVGDKTGGEDRSICLSPNGKSIAANVFGGTIFNAETGKVVTKLNPSSGVINVQGFYGDDLIASGKRNDGAGWLSLTSGSELSQVRSRTSSRITDYLKNTEYLKDTSPLAVTPDGKFAVCGSGDHDLVVWNIRTGREEQLLTGHQWRFIAAATFSPNGRYLATRAIDGLASNEAEVIIWDFPSGKSLHRFKLKSGWGTTSFAFSPDSRQLIVATAWFVYPPKGQKGKTQVRHGIQVRDVVKGTSQSLSGTGLSGIAKPAFSPSGKVFLTGGEEGEKQVGIIWDAKTRRRLRTLKPLNIEGTKIGGHDWHAAFSSDGKLLAILPKVGNGRTLITIWDVQTGKRLRTIFDRNLGRPSGAFFIPDSRLLMTGEVLWDVMSGDKLLHVRATNTQPDWIVTTPQGLFDGTANARQQVTFRVGGELDLVPLERFFQDFYQPGLLNQILSGARPLPKGALANKRAPRVRLIAPTKTKGSKEPKVKLVVNVTDEGGGIRGPWVKHNGAKLLVPSQGEKDGDNLNWTCEVTLVEGDNLLEVFAATEDGAWESEPARITLSHQRANAAPQLHLVAVGINKFSDASLNLNYATADAEAIASLFQKQGRELYGKDKVHVITLINEQATKERILGAFKETAKIAQPQDIFCLFLAGHGTMIGQRYFFIPHEFKTTSDDLEADVVKQGLAGDELNDAINRIPALKRVIIYDTCHSGGVVGITRTARNPFQFRKAMENLSRSQGSFVIAATAATDEAQEVEELGHGVLTYSLLAGAGAVDKGPLKLRRVKPAEGKMAVGVRDWLSFAQDEVPVLTRAFFGEEQFVRFSGSGINFPLLPASK